MTSWDETPGLTQDMLQGLQFTAIPGMPWDSPEELLELEGDRDAWASSLQLMPPRPRPR